MAHQKQEENELFACQNESCKKAFAKPLRALDFQAGSGEIYQACPYCLSQVSSIKAKFEVSSKEVRSTSSETQVSCAYHFGYLSERRDKDHVPDECIMCSEIVSCMLKGLKE